VSNRADGGNLIRRPDTFVLGKEGSYFLMSVTRALQTVRVHTGAAWLGTLLLAASAGLSGCGGQSDSLPKLHVYEVKGQVVLADGKPLRSGVISFVPKGDLPITPSANIAPDGTFSLVTGGSGEGAPSGEYKVRVEAPELRPDPKTKKAVFPFKYSDEDSSDIEITVLPQVNRLEPIRLK
jgi:hypothetical protein